MLRVTRIGSGLDKVGAANLSGIVTSIDASSTVYTVRPAMYTVFQKKPSPQTLAVN